MLLSFARLRSNRFHFVFYLYRYVNALRIEHTAVGNILKILESKRRRKTFIKLVRTSPYT